MSADYMLRIASTTAAWWRDDYIRWRDCEFTFAGHLDDGLRELYQSWGYSKAEIERATMDEDEHGALEGRLDLWRHEAMWVGQVSWAKALGRNDERYIPSAVANVSDVVHDAPIVTPRLISTVMCAMNAGNRSCYGKREYYRPGQPRDPSASRNRHGVYFVPARGRGGLGVARRQHIRKWLLTHVGDRVYGVSE